MQPERSAHPLTPYKLEEIKTFFGDKCEVIAEFNKKEQIPSSENLEDVILSIIKRRPVTLSDIAASLGKHQNEVMKYLNFLLEQDKIKYVFHEESKYYEPI